MASPLQHQPPRKGGQSHQCSSGLGRDHVLVPSQQKEVTCRAAIGTRRCGTVGAKAGGHYQDNTRVTSTPSDEHTDEGRAHDPLVTQVSCISPHPPPQAVGLG